MVSGTAVIVLANGDGVQMTIDQRVMENQVKRAPNAIKYEIIDNRLVVGGLGPGTLTAIDSRTKKPALDANGQILFDYDFHRFLKSVASSMKKSFSGDAFAHSLSSAAQKTFAPAAGILRDRNAVQYVVIGVEAGRPRGWLTSIDGGSHFAMRLEPIPMPVLDPKTGRWSDTALLAGMEGNQPAMIARVNVEQPALFESPTFANIAKAAGYVMSYEAAANPNVGEPFDQFLIGTDGVIHHQIWSAL